MQHPEHVPVNETEKVIWDFEIQMDYLTSLRRPDLVKINNKKEKERENLRNSGLCRPGRSQYENKRK